MEALKCPVCEGRQVVPEDFYPDGLKTTHCRSCEGKGYVTVPQQAAPLPACVPYYVPYYPSYPVQPWIWPYVVTSGTAVGNLGDPIQGITTTTATIGDTATWIQANPPGSSCSLTSGYVDVIR